MPDGPGSCQARPELAVCGFSPLVVVLILVVVPVAVGRELPATCAAPLLAGAALAGLGNCMA